MNKISENTANKKRFVLDGKIKDILLISVLAIALLLAVWKIFFTDERQSQTMASASENELKVCRLLEAIDGVGEAEVVVCETENGVRSVVVVCEGGNNLQVIMNVREAVAAALGTEEKYVKVYVKKE